VKYVLICVLDIALGTIFIYWRSAQFWRLL